MEINGDYKETQYWQPMNRYYRPDLDIDELTVEVEMSGFREDERELADEIFEAVEEVLRK